MTNEELNKENERRHKEVVNKLEKIINILIVGITGLMLMVIILSSLINIST